MRWFEGIQYHEFEVKEFLHHPQEDVGNFPHYVDWLVGICYPQQPIYGKDLEAVYLSITDPRVTFWIQEVKPHGKLDGHGWQGPRNHKQFLVWLEKVVHLEHSWPKPYVDAPKYNRPDWQPQSPIREFLRNNLAPNGYLPDTDLTAADGRDLYSGEHMVGTSTLVIADGRTYHTKRQNR